jgi:hypothetical protein
MTTRLSTKLLALSLALVMNGTLLGGMAYLVGTQAAQGSPVRLAAV